MNDFLNNCWTVQAGARRVFMMSSYGVMPSWRSEGFVKSTSLPAFACTLRIICEASYHHRLICTPLLLKA